MAVASLDLLKQIKQSSSCRRCRAKYVNEKVTGWSSEVKVLSEFAKSQSRTAYAAFCFGEQKKLSYFLRTAPEMNNLMKQENVPNFLRPGISG